MSMSRLYGLFGIHGFSVTKTKVEDQLQLKIYNCYHQAMASGIRHCQALAHTLLANAHGILAWNRHRISNGKVEAPTAKLKP